MLSYPVPHFLFLKQMAPRNLFYSAEKGARSFSSELDDTLEGDFEDVLSDTEDERHRRWQSSELTGCTPPQCSRGKADGGCLPVEAIALCIQRSSQDEKVLMETLNGPKYGYEGGESSKEHAKRFEASSSTSRHLANNGEMKGAAIAGGPSRQESKAVVSCSSSHVASFGSCTRSEQEVRGVMSSVHLENAVLSETALAKPSNIVMRQKLAETNVQSTCMTRKSSRTVAFPMSSCIGSAGESVKEGSCSDESRMDYAFAKSQNEFLKPEYSLTQMFEVAESTLACLEAPDVGFSQSESSGTGFSSEGVLACLVDGEKSKRSRQVEAKMPVSGMDSRNSGASQKITEASTSDAASASPPKEPVPDVMAAFFNPVKIEDVDKPAIKPSTFSTGFTTGSGKCVTVSAESLNAARHLLSGTEPLKHNDCQDKRALSGECDKQTNKLAVNSAACATSGRTSAHSIPGGFISGGGKLGTEGASAVGTAKQVLQCECDPCSTIKDGYCLEKLQDQQHCPKPCSMGNKLQMKAQFYHVDVAHEHNKSCASSAPAESDGVSAGCRVGAGLAISVQGTPLSTSTEPLFEDSTPGKNAANLEEAMKVETGFVTGFGKKLSVMATSLSSARRFLDYPNSELHGAKLLPTSNVSPLLTKDAGSRQVLPQNNLDPNGNMKSTDISEDSLNSAQTHFLSSNCKDAFRRVSTGFTTGSGKAVSISADSLKKVEDFLSEAEIFHNGNIALGTCDSYKKTQAGTSPHNSVAPFRAASGKLTSASADSLMKVEAFLIEAEKTSNGRALPCVHGDTPSMLDHHLPVTCSVYDSDKKTSTDSLQKVQALINEADKTCGSDTATCEDITLPGTLGLQSHSVTTCFRTGSGTSEVLGSLQKTGTFLSDTENLNKSDVISPENGTALRIFGHCPQSVATCFTTGSGKAVSVSADSLRKVEAFLSDAERSHNRETASLGNSDVPKMLTPQSVATCFTTCTGKPVSVSAKSLWRVEAVLNEGVLLDRGSSSTMLPNGTESFTEWSEQAFTHDLKNGANRQTDDAVGSGVTLTISMDEPGSIQNASKHDQDEAPCLNLSEGIRTSNSNQEVSTSIACSRNLASLPSGPLNNVPKIFRGRADYLGKEPMDKSAGAPARAKTLQASNTTPGTSGSILEIQKIPQDTSAMFKSKLKPTAKTPTFVTPFKAVGVVTSRTSALSKVSNAPTHCSFRKSEVQPGRLWMTRRRLPKTSKRISLREALGMDCPRFYSLKEVRHAVKCQYLMLEVWIMKFKVCSKALLTSAHHFEVFLILFCFTTGFQFC